MLTKERLAELRRLAAAATPGPWKPYILPDPFSVEACAKYVAGCLERGSLAEFWFVSATKPDGPADVCPVGNGPTPPANAAFIAAARTAIPELLDAVEQVREDCARTLDALAAKMENGYDEGTDGKIEGLEMGARAIRAGGKP